MKVELCCWPSGVACPHVYNPEQVWLPAGVQYSLEQYVSGGFDPGSFLRAVLENKLVEAFGAADPHRLRHLHDIVNYCVATLPSRSWMTPECVAVWIELKQRPHLEEVRRQSVADQGRV